MKKTVNLQDQFLNHLRKEKLQVTIYLLNGAKIRGLIKGFDSFSILLKAEVHHLIYKHSVAFIVPQKPAKETEMGREEKQTEEVVHA